MIKGVAELSNGRKLLLLGLDDTNVARLIHGKPIKVIGESVGLKGIDIAIMHGATCQDILNELRAAGVDLPEMKDPEPGETVVTVRDHGPFTVRDGGDR